MQYIKIHSQDNVAVALADMTAGSVVTIDNDRSPSVRISFAATKFALRAIAKGENVVKYGLPIGHALADIAPGEHVHAHNTRTNLSDLDAYRYQPDRLPNRAAGGSRSADLSSRQRRRRRAQ
jgi:altronate hydrolase